MAKDSYSFMIRIMMCKSVLVLVAWLGLLHAGSALSGETTTNNWQVLKIDMGVSGVLRFSVPPGAGTEFPGQHHETHVDISNDVIYYKPRSGPDYFEAFDRVWDFKGWFWQGTLGSMKMNILIVKKEKPGPLDSHERLLAEVDLTADASTAMAYKERWLRYRLLPRWGDITEYTTILDETHYLTIRFNFIENADPSGEWRQKAQAYADGIAESMVIEGP